MERPSTIERAFELARSGSCRSVDEIRMRLKRDRFDSVDAHLHGQTTVGQLRALCRAARQPAASEDVAQAVQA